MYILNFLTHIQHIYPRKIYHCLYTHRWFLEALHRNRLTTVCDDHRATRICCTWRLLRKVNDDIGQIQSLNLLGKPWCLSRSIRKSHFTESKVFLISSLNSKAGVFVWWNFLAKLCTYMKLSWILFFLMKALWALDTRDDMWGTRRVAIILASILPTLVENRALVQAGSAH